MEKALAGTSGANDSGVGARMMGTLLTWMEDRESEVFVVVTANHIESLAERHPEFFRRFDSIWFMDGPTRETKDAAWAQYQSRYGIPTEQEKPDDTGWTIAEIKKCCVEAARLDVPLTEASLRVVPVTMTAGDRIEAMRQWADKRALSADFGGVYYKNMRPKDTGEVKTRRRRVTRVSSND